MGGEPQTSRAVRFGTFELDLAAGQLRKNGLRVRLQDQPFQLLAALAARPGEVVTREVLKEKLWPSDTYVDFDRSLNTAASKLRDALGDSATSPRFVETLPRRGYRFLASVEKIGEPETAEVSPAQPGAVVRAEVVDTAKIPTIPRPLRHEGVLSRYVLQFALLVAVVVIVILWFRSPEPPQAPLARFSFTLFKYQWSPSISPNGRSIAYVALDEPQTLGQQVIWIQDLDQNEPREIEGTAGARSLFWSPDSSFLGFSTVEELKKVPQDGGTVTTLCRLPPFDFEGGAWSPNGETIVLISGGRFDEVSARGGTPQLMKDRDSVRGTRDAGSLPRCSHFLPLPEGERILLFTRNEGSKRQIVMRHLDTDAEEVLQSGRHPIYSPTGHIIYEGPPDYHDLWALPFSLAKQKSVGEAFPIAQNGRSASTAGGTLVYRRRGESAQWELQWRSRDGENLGRIGKPHDSIQHMALSPDESRIAINGWTEGNQDIWVHDVRTGVGTRLTFDRHLDIGPVWSPSGKELAFTSRPRGKTTDIFLKPADGAGAATELLADESNEFASDWSTDGRYILYDRNPPEKDTRSDIWFLQHKDDSMDFEPAPFLETAADEHAAKFSPDGRYVVYVSDESGEYEVYVRPFPPGGGQWQLSFNGGVQPQWRGDGKELFYVSGNTLMAVAVNTEPTFSLGRTSRLFESPGFRITQWSPRYDVSADGQRVVVREPLVEGVQSNIRVVQNWYEEFRDREQN